MKTRPMNAQTIRQKYLEFFMERGHILIPSASLIPEGDVTTLFTGSGMQQLLPYLLGQTHPAGRRIVDSQKCFRAEDIDEVGDNRHTTFFEMLGNWSLGDYFKQEQLPWIFEFLVDVVGLNPEHLYVTVFSGDSDNNIPKDTEAAQIWQKLFTEKGIAAKTIELGSVENGSALGLQGGRIFYYDVTKNWWSRAGVPAKMPAREPGGPDSEIFYEFTDIEHSQQFGAKCHPNCDCGRFMEIGNSVFMEYVKEEDGTFARLAQPNVDFGGGLERIAAASQGDPDMFQIALFTSIIEALGTAAKTPNLRSQRIVADHIRASVFLIGDGVIPSNKERGYLLRRLIRRAVTHGQYLLGLPAGFLSSTLDGIITTYQAAYPEVNERRDVIHEVFTKEQQAFERTYAVGIKEFHKIIGKAEMVSGLDTFNLLATHGFPPELTEELAGQLGKAVDRKGFKQEVEKHRELSRAGQQKKFGGHGLILDTGELRAANQEELTKVTRLHTATHLLQAALRKVLGEHVFQKGSDITAERLRFDFTHDEKLTPTQITQVEELLEGVVSDDYPMQYVELPLEQAKTTGALFLPHARYPEKVKVYFVGRDLATAFSKEFCGGPHVTHTAEVGKVKIVKDEPLAAGVRRLRATVD
jgi:alanyl-tRNA synthetase